ncbi:MAG: hypothetical protein JW931_08640 [Methanomicrobiaceae archaeon]|nr:hypothetical protein [Methanomicrobiaceae archaeon]
MGREGSAFLCAMTGIDMPVIDNQTAYIAGWLRHIRNGSAVDVIRAAGGAQYRKCPTGADLI